VLTGRNEQNPFDVVASQGKCLLPAPNTPLFGKTDAASEHFATELRIGLERVLRMQKGKHQKCGEQVAEEWPQGRNQSEGNDSSNGSRLSAHQ
jgi:hypothetical protein